MDPSPIKYLLACAAVFLAAGLLSGCATLKKEECLAADWYQVGFEDGAGGHEAARIARHRKACAKHGVTPDLDLYQRGRQDGLVQYCTPARGFQTGRHGRDLKAVCQGRLKEAFLSGYYQGLDIFRFESRITRKAERQAWIEKQIEQIRETTRAREAKLGKTCEDPDACRRALDAIRQLDREKADLETEHHQLTDQIRAMKATLSDMEAGVRF